MEKSVSERIAAAEDWPENDHGGWTGNDFWLSVRWAMKSRYYDVLNYLFPPQEQMRRSMRYPYDYSWIHDEPWSRNISSPWQIYGYRWPREHWLRDRYGNVIEPELPAERAARLRQWAEEERQLRKERRWHRRLHRRLRKMLLPWTQKEEEKEVDMKDLPEDFWPKWAAKNEAKAAQDVARWKAEAAAQEDHF